VTRVKVLKKQGELVVNGFGGGSGGSDATVGLGRRPGLHAGSILEGVIGVQACWEVSGGGSVGAGRAEAGELMPQKSLGHHKPFIMHPGGGGDAVTVTLVTLGQGGWPSG
jgi:hypothetical protein